MQKHTHEIRQHGKTFRRLDMSDSNARQLVRDEWPNPRKRRALGIQLVKGPYQRDHKTGQVARR